MCCCRANVGAGSPAAAPQAHKCVKAEKCAGNIFVLPLFDSWCGQGELPPPREVFAGAENSLAVAGLGEPFLLPPTLPTVRGGRTGPAQPDGRLWLTPMGSRSGDSWIDVQSQSWRELHSSCTEKPQQLTLRSMTVALIPTGLKLLLQNESIQPPKCPNADTQPRGVIQHPWLCPGQGTRCWTMLELVCVRGLTPSSTNPSLCPSVPVGRVPARDRYPAGGIRVRRWVHGPCQCLITSVSTMLPLSPATATLAAAPLPNGHLPSIPTHAWPQRAQPAAQHIPVPCGVSLAQG